MASANQTVRRPTMLEQRVEQVDIKEHGQSRRNHGPDEYELDVENQHGEEPEG